ncbi:MAG: hypothetical protein NDI69_15305 [Bacteriovoracaceae bacterium]|nr:hypothetical protein [Bacteriovoracaceae bacterium]
MQTKALNSDKQELTFLDFAVALYLRRWKIIILALGLFLFGVLIIGLPKESKSIESVVNMGTINTQYPLDSFDELALIVKSHYLVELSSDKQINLSIEPFGGSPRLFKLISFVGGFEDIERIKGAHQEIADKIIARHNALIARIDESDSTFFTTPTRVLYIGKTNIINAWNSEVVKKFFKLLLMSFVFSVGILFSVEFLIMVNQKSSIKQISP